MCKLTIYRSVNQQFTVNERPLAEDGNPSGFFTSLQVVTKQDSWRPPIPPAKWVNFDPTPNCSNPAMQLGAMSEKRETMGDSMIKGDEPSNIRRKSIFMADFMKREVKSTFKIAPYTKLAHCLDFLMQIRCLK